MKKMIIIMLSALLTTTAFGGDAVWLPVAVPKGFWDNETKKQKIKNAVCEFAGQPQTEAGFQAIKKRLTWTDMTNVVGNTNIGVPTGSDWYINANSGKNWFGASAETNILEYTFITNGMTNVIIHYVYIDLDARVDILKANTNITDLMLIGEFNNSPITTIEYWGLMSQ